MTTNDQAPRVWSGAEFRARLFYLGLSLEAFSRISGRDLRTLRRIATGQGERVSKPLAEEIRELEALAEEQLTEWKALALGGEPITIRSLGVRQKNDELPPRWDLALAGRLRHAWGDAINIQWDTLDPAGK